MVYKALFWYLTVPVAAGLAVKFYLDKRSESEAERSLNLALRLMNNE